MIIKDYISQLNKLIKEVQSEDYTYPTEYGYMQNAFARLIIPTERKNGGQIRTLEEVNAELSRIYGVKAIHLTEEEYKSEFLDLRKQLRGYLTRPGFYHTKYREYLDIIKLMAKELNLDIDYSELTLDMMRDLVEQANEMSKNDTSGSETFYAHLANLMGLI